MIFESKKKNERGTHAGFGSFIAWLQQKISVDNHRLTNEYICARLGMSTRTFDGIKKGSCCDGLPTAGCFACFWKNWPSSARRSNAGSWLNCWKVWKKTACPGRGNKVRYKLTWQVDAYIKASSYTRVAWGLTLVNYWQRLHTRVGRIGIKRVSTCQPGSKVD